MLLGELMDAAVQGAQAAQMLQIFPGPLLQACRRRTSRWSAGEGTCSLLERSREQL